MKTKIISISFICLLGLGKLIAQPNTGKTLYSHASTNPILSAGTYVSTDPGFIMAGFRATVASGPNLVIDKVDIDGLFNGSTGEFSKQYTVTTGGYNCNVSLNPAVDCSGISIIETFQGADQYAIAASFNDGCIIAFLTRAGAVTTSKFYPFPASITTNLFCKPLITESNINPGNYYIVGNYRFNSKEYLYVIYTDINFTSGWTATYDVGANTILRPTGIVESNFSVGSGELIVVGWVDIGTGNNTDGFMLALDNATNGAVNFANRYYSNSTPVDRFASVQLAYSNSGYIVGGYSAANTGNGFAWMTRITAGGGLNWSKMIEFFNDPSAGEVVGVQERYNTNSAYEYFGLSTSSGGGSGMLTCKLDNNGAAFGGGQDEFFYNPSTFDQSSSISSNNSPSNPNEGIHFFGNSNNSPNEYEIIQSCFNGPAGNVGGQWIGSLTSVNTGPNNVTGLSVNVSSGLNPCSYYGITSSSINVSPSRDGTYLTGTWPSNPTTGSNAKSAFISGVNENLSTNKIKLNIYPNPTVGRLNLNISGLSQGDFSVEIQNILGQSYYYKKFSIQNSSPFELNLDLKEIKLENGLYLVKTLNGSESQESKFIYDKE